MDNELTVGQKKAKQQREKTLGDPLGTPSYFQPGTLEALEKEADGNDTAKRILEKYRPVAEATRRDVEDFNAVRQHNLINDLVTDTAATVETYEESEKLYNDAAERCKKAEDDLLEIHQNLEEKINIQITAAADKSKQATDIQRHVEGLPDKQARLSFIRKQMKAGDLETVAVIVTRKPFLSGLDPEDVQHLKEQARKTLFPDENAGIEFAAKLRENVGSGFLSLQEKIAKYDTPDIRRTIAFRDRAKKRKK